MKSAPTAMNASLNSLVNNRISSACDENNLGLSAASPGVAVPAVLLFSCWHHIAQDPANCSPSSLVLSFCPLLLQFLILKRTKFDWLAILFCFFLPSSFTNICLHNSLSVCVYSVLFKWDADSCFLGTFSPACVLFCCVCLCGCECTCIYLLTGNDVNLVKILLCGSKYTDKKFVNCGIVMWECQKLTLWYNLVYFLVVFGDTICEVYLQRRDTSQIRLYTQWWWLSLLWVYKAFSAKADNCKLMHVWGWWQPPTLSVPWVSCKIEEVNMKHPWAPMNVPALFSALSVHPNRCFVNYIISGLVQEILASLCWLPKVM